MEKNSSAKFSKYLNTNRTSETGFTLVELAIVMIIIGLLIGGVLQGQKLIENARVKSTITAVDGYKTALYTFRSTYGGMPGDLTGAATRLQGCAAGNANNCAGGNGNAIIGNVIGGVTALEVGLDVSNNPENVLAWKHMALANLITGVNPSASIAANNFAWGESHPASSWGGGWTIVYANDRGDNTYGHALRLHRDPNGNILNQRGIHILTAAQAANIDRKLDDGHSNTGWVQSEYFGSYCDRSGTYDEDEGGKNCWMIFLLE
jgi:prepilin-type N-terminal cleavage/methylation domain-containing protein